MYFRRTISRASRGREKTPPQTPVLMRSKPSHIQITSIVYFHPYPVVSIWISFHQAAIWLSTRMLNIMTSKPIVTMMSNVNENQPITMALVPTPDLTEPLPKSCAMTDAATEAVCCHRTETRTKMDEMKMMARAIWETGREGKGLTSRSEPSLSSSSCQPGKVARRMKQMKAKTIAMMLIFVRKGHLHRELERETHIRYGNTIMSLNCAANQMRFNGS